MQAHPDEAVPVVNGARAFREVRLRHQSKIWLAGHYKTISGWVGGMHHPEAWSKDDLIACILNIEYPEPPYLPKHSDCYSCDEEASWSAMVQLIAKRTETRAAERRVGPLAAARYVPRHHGEQ